MATCPENEQKLKRNIILLLLAPRVALWLALGQWEIRNLWLRLLKEAFKIGQMYLTCTFCFLPLFSLHGIWTWYWHNILSIYLPGAFSLTLSLYIVWLHLLTCHFLWFWFCNIIFHRETVKFCYAEWLRTLWLENSNDKHRLPWPHKNPSFLKHFTYQDWILQGIVLGLISCSFFIKKEQQEKVCVYDSFSALQNLFLKGENFHFGPVNENLIP